MPQFSCGNGVNSDQSPTTLYENPDKLDIANEVLSSAIRVLQATGFHDDEIVQLFDQVAKGWRRGPLWLQRLPDQPT
jgi:hypothetical protein